jgi:hypothetical protein
LVEAGDVLHLVAGVAPAQMLGYAIKPLTHIWTPRLLQDKFSQLMPSTEIMIAAIYPVS